MRTSLEERRRQYRVIYENILETPRIKPKPLSRIMRKRPSVVETRIQEAFNLVYVSGPHLRKLSYKNFKEYMYFINCEDPFELYLKYSEDNRVVYHARMDGFSNLWVISKEKIDVEDVVIEGYRSDYYISFAPDHSWEKAIKIMWEKIKNFSTDDYQPKGIIKCRWNRLIDWDENDEALFRYFKYNLRKPLSPMIKRSHKIPEGKIEQWLRRLPETCTIATVYFPKKLSAYDPYLYMFETEYEDFIIELFSELPTSSLFFRVSNKLFSRLYLDRQYLRNFDSPLDDVNQLHIPLMLRELTKMGILQNRTRAEIANHCRKDL